MNYNITKEVFEKKYDNFLNRLCFKKDKHFHKLITEKDNIEFGILRNNNSVFVKAITEKETEMTISKKQLVDVLFNNKEYLYSSYEPVIIDYIINDKLNNLSELCEYYDYYKDLDKNKIIFGNGNNILETKNIMLYGSPGIGKTHNYKKLITMIENNRRDEKTIFDTISKNDDTSNFNYSKFDEAKKDNRVEFITFHQSYSYEDFIEGFRPQDNGNIKLEDGIFKKLCDKAKDNFEDSKLTLEDYNKKYNLLRNFRFYAEIKVEKKESIKSGNIEFKFSKFDKDILYFTIIENDKYFLDSFITFDMIKESFKQPLNDIYDENIAFICTDFKIYMKKLKIIISYDKKYEATRDEKNFYIVIDEINRGNISKIFGELITLIEEDKRDDYEVTLPYSKEKFKIPSNLYIIATMNSTDKSIATIDIALRRRFIFLKMRPNLDLVENQEAKKLMEDLNKHISKTINEDYALGHSYFMKIKNEEDLEFVKEYKIKPLLEEYFYGDEENYKKAENILYKKEIE